MVEPSNDAGDADPEGLDDSSGHGTGWSQQQPPPGPPPPAWGAAAPPQPPSPPGWAPPPPGWAPPPAAPQPGIIPLRPLTLGETLEGAWRLVRRHWRVLFVASGTWAVLSAALQLPFALGLVDAMTEWGRALTALAPQGAPAPTVEEVWRVTTSAFAGWPTLTGWLLLSTVVTLLGLVVVAAVVSLVAGRAVLGRPAAWSAVWGELRHRLTGVLGTGVLLVGGIVAGEVVVVVLPVLAWLAGGAGAGLLALPVSLALAVLMVFAAVRLLAAVPASALEDAGPATAVRRSWRLMSGHWWRTFGLLLLLGVIVGGLNSVLSTPVSFSVQLDPGAVDPTDPFAGSLSRNLVVASTLVGVVTNTLAYPFVVAAVVLRYLDVRMRKESLAERLRASARDDLTS